MVEQNALAVVNVTLAAPQYQTTTHEVTFCMMTHQLPPLLAPQAPASIPLALTAAVCRCSRVRTSATYVPLHSHSTCDRLRVTLKLETQTSVLRLGMFCWIVRVKVMQATCKVHQSICDTATLKNGI